MVKPDIFFLEFYPVHRNGRCKMTQDAFDHIHRDTPDPEKAQDMIDPECVEIIAHVFESLFPPGIAIVSHLFPVVGRKTPILPFDGKIIGRGPRLLIHVIELRRHPGITAIAVNANRDIPLEDNSMFVRIVYRIPQLKMQMVLNEILEENSVIMQGAGRSVFSDGLGIIMAVQGPTGKIRRSVLVPQITKSRIRDQPVLIPGKKIEEVRIFLKFFFL